MSEFEALHAQLAENLEKRKNLTRLILEMKKEYYQDNMDLYVLTDQLVDWEFDLFILQKEANRIMRKMFKVDPHQAAELEDLSTD